MGTLAKANICGVSTALFIQCIIAGLALHKMVRNCEIGHRQYLQYFGSFLFAVTATIFQLLLLRVIDESDSFYDIYTIIIYACLLLFHLSLLSTLVLRLHKTFSKSNYAMPKVVTWGFIAMFVVEISLIIAFFITGDALPTLIFYVLYIIGSTLAVTFFVRSLSRLVMSRIHTLRDSVVTPDDIHLDPAQQKLVELAAKYVLLFILAIFSTISALSVGGYLVPSLASTVVALDFCVNLLCLHLQFHFATKQYQTLCGCLDKQCIKAVTAKTKRAIANEQSISRALSLQLGLGTAGTTGTAGSTSPQATSGENQSD